MVAFIAAGFTIICLAFFILMLGFSPRKVGAFLYAILLLGGLLQVALAGPLAGRLFADERRNNMLGLIFSTGVTASEVLLGKLAAVLVIPLSRLLGLVPCLMIVPLLRAATPEICIAVIVTLCALLALTLSIHLFSSLVFEEHSASRTFADVSLVLIIGLVPVINLLNIHFAGVPLDPSWLCLSPGFAPMLLYNSPNSNHMLEYVYRSNLFSAALAAILFTASAILVSRIWREQSFGSRSSYLTTLSWFKARRKQRARTLLERNPYQWLICRDFQPMLTSVLALGTIGVIWLAAFWHWEAAWLVPLNFWATLLLVGSVIRGMITYIFAKQIGRDRSTGALELILTTPLSVGDIIFGQQQAVRHYVRPLFWAVGFLHCLFFILGFIFHPMNSQALINYTLISLLVAVLGPWFNFQHHWTAFWISLNTGRPALALRKSFWENTSTSTIAVYLFLFRDKFGTIPNGGFAETLFVTISTGFVLFCFIIIKMGWDSLWSVTREKLRSASIGHMRAIAAEPVPEANDPRLKKWDHNKPLFHPEPEDDKIMV